MSVTFRIGDPPRAKSDVKVNIAGAAWPLSITMYRWQRTQRGTRNVLSPDRATARSNKAGQLARAGWRVCAVAIRNRRGVSALEFALVAPVLFMVVFGIIQFGITFNNYLALTDGVRAASRVLAASRSSTSPMTSSKNALYASAPNLTQSSITITLSVAGTACTGDSACATALTAAAGGSSSVQATYPCNLTIMGVNYAPSCTLTSATTERVE